MSEDVEVLMHKQQCLTRCHLLGGASALAASGWLSGFIGGFVLRPRWAHAEGPIKIGIATDITGALATAGLQIGK